MGTFLSMIVCMKAHMLHTFKATKLYSLVGPLISEDNS